MQITLTPTLRKHKKDRAGLCPIAIAIRGGGEEMFHYTRIKVLPEHWDGSKIAKGVANHDVLNNDISRLVQSTEREILLRQSAGDILTLEDVKDILSPGTAKRGNFMAFYRSYVDNLIKTGKAAPGTVAIWETLYTELLDYVGDNLPFSRVNKTFLNGYHERLSAYRDKNNEPYAGTTIFKKLRQLMRMVRKAVREQLVDGKQVDGFEMVRYVEPETEYLTLPQTVKIATRLYAGDYDYDHILRVTAAFFLVECYSGIRVSDWSRFEVETLLRGDSFKVRTTKGKQPVYLDLSVFTSLRTIVGYIHVNDLRFDIAEQTANIALKQIGRDLKLKFPLTTHAGRHTFGTLLGEMCYTTRFISEAMGISQRTAERYIRITKQSMKNEQAVRGGF